MSWPQVSGEGAASVGMFAEDGSDEPFIFPRRGPRRQRDWGNLWLRLRWKTDSVGSCTGI